MIATHLDHWAESRGQCRSDLRYQIYLAFVFLFIATQCGGRISRVWGRVARTGRRPGGRELLLVEWASVRHLGMSWWVCGWGGGSRVWKE